MNVFNVDSAIFSASKPCSAYASIPSDESCIRNLNPRPLESVNRLTKTILFYAKEIGIFVYDWVIFKILFNIKC